MAGSIKGITIEIGGDTTDLSKALSEVNGETRSLQSELRQVDKLLKLDPENITLCEQKEQLLTAAIEATKEKLDTLKEAEAQVQEQFENGEISEEQYRALERQIAQTEIQLQTYENELAQVQSADDETKEHTDEMGKSFKDAGNDADKMGDEGTSAADEMAEAFANAGITKIIGEIIEKMQELVDIYSESVAAIVEGTGATGESLDGLEESLTNVFAKCTDGSATMQDVANVLAEVNTRTGETGEGLEDLTLQILEFAEHTGTDGVAAVDGLMDIEKKWGLTTADSTHLMDLLTVANQSCSLSVDDLMGYLTDNKVQFEQLGYSVDDATALLVSLADSGVDTGAVMGGLKKAVTNLSETTDDVPGTFNAMIESIADCDSVSEALGLQVGDTGKTVSDVFGAKAAQEIVNAVQSGNFALEDWQNVLADCDGALESTAEAANTTQDSWQQAQNNIALTAQQIFAPALESVSMGLAQIVTKVTEVVRDSPALQAIIVALAAAFAVLAGALAITGIINAVQAAMALLNLEFLMCPITWIVLAIAALVAAFIYLWNNCDAFREFWINLWETIKTVFDTVWTAIQTFFTVTVPQIVQGVIDWFRQLPENLKNFFLQILTNLIEWGANMLSNAKSAASNVVTGIISFISQLPGKILAHLLTALANVISWGSDIVSKAKEAAKNMVTGAVTSIAEMPGKIANKLGEVVGKVASWGSNLVSQFTGIGRNIISGIISGIGSMVSSLYSSIKNALSGLVDKAKSALGIHSPSKVFADSVGAWIPKGIGSGIDEEMPELEEDTDEQLESFAKNTNRKLKEKINFGENLTNMVNGRDVVTPITKRGSSSDDVGSVRNGGTFNQTVNITSSKELSPAETARQTRNATRRFVQAMARG